MTAEDWAPYGIGEPDADGWYPDYRPVPEALKPAAVTDTPKPEIDSTWLAIIREWRIVTAELAERYRIDLHDTAVRARPWPGVRTMIFALLDDPSSRLRAVLRR
ncbi:MULTISPECIES: hypothetical protein [unclassified Microbacterium]|uniref:hypothetical protein n=1 Tax=unclassified Microbacterium TaxID=2609290 RepID=UPI0036594888